MRTTEKGAIIRHKIAISVGTALAWHYAIDMGDDDIAHFHPQFKFKHMKRGPGIITKESRGDHDWEIVEKPPTKHKADAVVKISLEFVGKEMEYDLLKRNCEHFAHFCYKAEVQSDQVLFGKGFAGASIVSTSVVAASGTANAFIAASTPAATVFGSEMLGSLAVSAGLMAAPTAPAWVPIVAGIGAVGTCASITYGVVKWVIEKTPIPLIEANEKKECNLCMESNASVRFLPCDHIMLCLTCSFKVEKCPQCRCDIEKKVQIFKSVTLND